MKNSELDIQFLKFGGKFGILNQNALISNEDFRFHNVVDRHIFKININYIL